MKVTLVISKPSLPQHHGDLLFVFLLVPTLAILAHIPQQESPFFMHSGHHRDISPNSPRKGWCDDTAPSQAAPSLSPLCCSICHCYLHWHHYLVPTTASWPIPSQQEQMEVKRFSLLSTWCLLSVLQTTWHVWWDINRSRIHFHQVDGMDVSSFSYFQNGLELWNMKGKSSSLQRWCFLVSME